MTEAFVPQLHPVCPRCFAVAEPGEELPCDCDVKLVPLVEVKVGRAADEGECP